MRATRFVLATVTLLVVVGVATAAPVRANGVTVTVTPAADLLDGQPVTVTASGLAAGSYYVFQCSGDTCQHPVSPWPDPFSAPNSTFEAVGEDGALSVRLQLTRVLEVDEQAFDCTVVACTVRVVTSVGATVATSAPVGFAPEGTYQFPEATLTLERTEGLMENERIDVGGSGYDWFNNPIHHTITGTASVETCRDVPEPTEADCHPLAEPSLDTYNAGDVVAVGDEPGGQLRVRRHLTLPSGTWDCAVSPCTVALVQEGSPRSNRVSISFAPEWAPWSSASVFVRAYERVRGRTLDEASRSALAASLASRSREGVEALLDAARAARNDDGASNADVGEVVRLYQAFFARPPETAGLAYWVDRMGAGMSSAAVAQQFGGTAEFRATYGNVSNTVVVQRAYQNSLGRAADSAGLAYWKAKLDQGMPRWRLLHHFSGSAELRTREAKDVALTLVTFALAGRAPTVDELTPASAHGPVADLLISGTVDLTP